MGNYSNISSVVAQAPSPVKICFAIIRVRSPLNCLRFPIAAMSATLIVGSWPTRIATSRQAAPFAGNCIAHLSAVRYIVLAQTGVSFRSMTIH